MEIKEKAPSKNTNLGKHSLRGGITGVALSTGSWAGDEEYNCSCTNMQAHVVLITCKSQDTPAAFEKRFRHSSCC